MNHLLALLCAVTATFGATVARADERILDFRSDIRVNADASMDVTETIRVRAEGDRIRHGIYRDFPTDYRDRYGNHVRVEFKPLDAQRDGTLEEWRSERYGNGVRVYLGSAGSYVDRGEHDYQIRYHTTRQLGFFADHDELYWNVTGNGWDFPIDHAGARVTLPGDVSPDALKLSAYTGPQGAQGRDWRGAADALSQATFETTRALSARAGLTIAVEFPHGVVSAPTAQQRLIWLLQDNVHIVIGAVGLLLTMVYLGIAWWRLGRDPRAGPVMPLYEAPADWSPAELRYVERMDYDDRCFAADLVDLGVHGALEISQAGGKFTLHRRAVQNDTLGGVERTLFDGLLGASDELVMQQSEHATIGGARRAHRQGIENARGKGYFNTNAGKLGSGVLLALLTVYLVDATAGNLPLHDSNGKTVPSFVLLLFSLFPIVFGGIGVGIISSIVVRRRNPAARHFVFDSLKFVGALIPCAAGALIGLPGGWFGFGLAAVLIGVITAAAILLPAPTRAGRKLLDQIAGLRLYLGVAERDALVHMRTPEMTQKEFERFLPFALALEVEKTWCDRFAAAVGPAAAAAAMTSMAWYQGTSSSSFGSFASDIGSSLSSTISASASAPGSSSGGSSGGGSSGGGGGGGGGGGW
jgi:type II secretory pathway pseudopilin PulG